MKILKGDIDIKNPYGVALTDKQRHEGFERCRELFLSQTVEVPNTIVCLCGSGRFKEAFEKAEFDETLEGKIVLTIGCNTHDIARTDELKHHKPMLDELHLRKIDLADEVLILNVGGYIGESTSRELAYARSKGKTIRFLELHPRDKLTFEQFIQQHESGNDRKRKGTQDK
jgi:hypothetical protein